MTNNLGQREYFITINANDNHIIQLFEGFQFKNKKNYSFEGAAGTVTVRAMEYGISMFNASRILQHFNP